MMCYRPVMFMYARRCRSIFVLAVLTALFGTASARALPLHETWFVDHTPTQEQVRDWNELPGTRNYVLRIENPSASDLELVSQIRGHARLELQVAHLPNASFFVSRYPLYGEVPALKSIPATTPILISTDYPLGTDQKAALEKLSVPVEWTHAP